MAGWHDLQQQVQQQVQQRVGEAQQRVGEATDWTRRLATEVRLLPDTMFRLRDGARNFQTAGQHLASSAKALDEVGKLYEKSVSSTVRQSTSALERLQEQVGRLGRLPDPAAAPEAAARLNEQVRDAIEALAAVNPLWPPTIPGRSTGPRSSGGGS